MEIISLLHTPAVVGGIAIHPDEPAIKIVGHKVNPVEGLQYIGREIALYKSTFLRMENVPCEESGVVFLVEPEIFPMVKEAYPERDDFVTLFKPERIKGDWKAQGITR